MEPDLDSWLPNPQVRTRNRRSAQADPDRLSHAAEQVRLSDTQALGRAVRWRIPGTPPELSFRDLFRQYPFAVIAEGDRWSVSGMCGRIWTLRRDYPRIEGADDFLAWDDPNTVRVLLAHWTERDGPRQSALVSEARIKPVDRQTGMGLRALWAVVRHLERLIGSEAFARCGSGRRAFLTRLG